MKRLCIILLPLLLLSLSTEAQTTQQWRDSLNVLSKQISALPRSTDLRLRKAAVNIQLNQWEYAIEEYGRVLELDAHNPAALYYRAYALVHLRQYVRALRDYESFLALAPNHFEARLGLAIVKRKMGKSTETLDEMNRLVQLHPDSAVAYAVRADYETEQKLYEPALYDWDEAIRLSPRTADYVASKVELLLQLRRYAEAWTQLEEAQKQGIPRAALKKWIDRCK